MPRASFTFFLFGRPQPLGRPGDRSKPGLLYPVVRPLDAVFAKFTTGFLTMFIVGLLLYVGLIRYYELPVNLDLAAIFNGFLIMGLLGLGRHAELRDLRLLADLAAHLERADQAPLHRLGDVLHLRIDAAEAAGDLLVQTPDPRHRAAALGLLRRLQPGYVGSALRAGNRRHGPLMGAYLLRRHRSALLEC